MSDIYNPIKNNFKEPLIKNMCEYKDLVQEFNIDYLGTWANFS
jgi:acetyl-CoA synthetase